MREELTAARSENPFAYWRESPREVARILAQADRAKAEALWKALGGRIGCAEQVMPAVRSKLRQLAALPDPSSRSPRIPTPCEI
jgi:hypothetical protein